MMKNFIKKITLQGPFVYGGSTVGPGLLVVISSTVGLGLLVVISSTVGLGLLVAISGLFKPIALLFEEFAQMLFLVAEIRRMSLTRPTTTWLIDGSLYQKQITVKCHA